MLDVAKPDIVLAFRCDGISRGTDHMISSARAAGIQTVVFRKDGTWVQHNRPEASA